MRQLVNNHLLTSLQAGGGRIINLQAPKSRYLNGFKKPSLQSGGNIRDGSEIRTYNGGQSGGSVRSGTEVRSITSIHKGGSRKRRITRNVNGMKKSQHKKRLSRRKN